MYDEGVMPYRKRSKKKTCIKSKHKHIYQVQNYEVNEHICSYHQTGEKKLLTSINLKCLYCDKTMRDTKMMSLEEIQQIKQNEL